MPLAGTSKSTTLYDVLSLAIRKEGEPAVSSNELKTAYHRALLLNHPDKVLLTSANPPTPDGRAASHASYTVDEIVEAYEVLSNPSSRLAYDERLQNERRSQTVLDRNHAIGTHIGVEAFDLEAMDFDETNEFWFKSCRCGNTQGYVVRETDLEGGITEGEIYVGCTDCSLFIKVLFELAEEQDNHMPLNPSK